MVVKKKRSLIIFISFIFLLFAFFPLSHIAQEKIIEHTLNFSLPADVDIITYNSSFLRIHFGSAMEFNPLFVVLKGDAITFDYFFDMFEKGFSYENVEDVWTLIESNKETATFTIPESNDIQKIFAFSSRASGQPMTDVVLILDESNVCYLYIFGI